MEYLGEEWTVYLLFSIFDTYLATSLLLVLRFDIHSFIRSLLR